MESVTSPNLLTVSQFSERHPAFSEGSLRNLIFLSKSSRSDHGGTVGNGLDKALVRVGRRVFIDETKFFEWLSRASRNNPRQLSFDFSGNE